MTTFYSGEKITVNERPIDPATSRIITDASGTVEFFAPPKNPRDNPFDRTPDHTAVLTWSPATRYYTVDTYTTGWAPGTWWIRTTITGGANGYLSWAYTSFPLLA